MAVDQRSLENCRLVDRLMRPNELARMPSTRGSRGKRAPPATAILTTQANAAMPPSHDLSNCRHYSTLGEARMGVKAVSGASPSTVRRALLLDILLDHRQRCATRAETFA